MSRVSDWRTTHILPLLQVSAGKRPAVLLKDLLKSLNCIILPLNSPDSRENRGSASELIAEPI